MSDRRPPIPNFDALPAPVQEYLQAWWKGFSPPAGGPLLEEIGRLCSASLQLADQVTRLSGSAPAPGLLPLGFGLPGPAEWARLARRVPPGWALRLPAARRRRRAARPSACPRVPGIYAIVNRRTGEAYVGQSVNVYRRLEEHRRQLRRGDGINARMQAAWDRHGEHQFELVVLERVAGVERRAQRERHWIGEYLHGAGCYNHRLGPGQNKTTRGRVDIGELGRNE